MHSGDGSEESDRQHQQQISRHDAPPSAMIPWHARRREQD
jgi:hypothetical protein